MNMEEQALEYVGECIDTYNEHFPSRPFLKWVSVTFKTRGRTAGWAFYKECLIDLNYDIMRNNEKALHDTTKHEVCHLLAHHHDKGCSAHGSTWKAMMILMGQSPDRLHDYDSKPARKTRKFIYTCDCRSHTIGAVRHNRQQKAKETVYRCSQCKSNLHLKGEKE